MAKLNSTLNIEKHFVKTFAKKGLISIFAPP